MPEVVAEATRTDGDESIRTQRLPLFLTAAVLGGTGAIAGSILGHFAGAAALRIGALAGGGSGVVLATSVARRRRWVDHRDFIAATAGGLAGFLCAAAVAVSTMHSPIGPAASTLLIGLGALAGTAYSTRARAQLSRQGTVGRDHRAD